jgi:hypothetical protein
MHHQQLKLRFLARQGLCAWPVLTAVNAPRVFAQSTSAPAPAGTLLHDFDHDGVEERLVSRPGVNEIFHRNPQTQEWEKADYTLPEGGELVVTRPGAGVERGSLKALIADLALARDAARTLPAA